MHPERRYLRIYAEPSFVTLSMTDQAMLGLLINRVLPAVRPETAPVRVDLPNGSLAERAEAVVAAVASGGLSASVASELLAGPGVVGRLRELDEITKRLTALQARSGGGQ
jgi:hypothetical protein